MKVLHLNTFDIIGGAARAAYRLHAGLQRIGVDSQMRVARRFSDDPNVHEAESTLSRKWARLRPFISSLPLQFYPDRDGRPFAPQWIGANVADAVAKADVVNLHWVCGGFLTPEMIGRIKKPIVWTLHDMWAFTGGCHYAGDCTRYKDSCGACPQLGSSRQRDLSRKVWRRKMRAWDKLDLTLVTPSRWLAECARQSALFRSRRIKVIPHCLDTDRYKPLDKTMVREILGLPTDKKIILFGAISTTRDTRKGFQHLRPALNNLSKCGLDLEVEIVIFGPSRSRNAPDFGIKTHYVGRLNDDISLALLYATADVMIMPSQEEAFGQTASEAIACGTPVVTFDSTGLRDIVDHKINGYRAECYKSDDLARGIAWVLQDEQRWQLLSRQARRKAENAFAPEIVAQRYADLYKEVVG
ncbi:MAG: glycosyltransferase family 4 protein [Anaerolineae bacterium]